MASPARPHQAQARRLSGGCLIALRSAGLCVCVAALRCSVVWHYDSKARTGSLHHAAQRPRAASRRALDSKEGARSASRREGLRVAAPLPSAPRRATRREGGGERRLGSEDGNCVPGCSAYCSTMNPAGCSQYDPPPASSVRRVVFTEVSARTAGLHRATPRLYRPR